MMKYVESNRTVEAHSECVLILYLKDANGSPVPNVKIRIWAGPPPTGHPPYYQDDESADVNRRTDSSGKFQFIVANPTPTEPLDFYVQAIGQDEDIQSDPVHFPFPPQKAQWVIVTMAEEVAPESAGEPLPTADQPAGPVVQLEEASGSRTADVPSSAGTAPTPTSPVALEPPVPPKLPLRPKPFTHYLLLGPGSQPGTLTNLILALDYIIRFAPLVGFSPDEAKNAEHVTIVGDTNALSPTLEQSLRDAGCKVARISASDSYALENAFKQLIDSGTPYPTN
jgi:hypothetical protein